MTGIKSAAPQQKSVVGGRQPCPVTRRRRPGPARRGIGPSAGARIEDVQVIERTCASTSNELYPAHTISPHYWNARERAPRNSSLWSTRVHTDVNAERAIGDRRCRSHQRRIGGRPRKQTPPWTAAPAAKPPDRARTYSESEIDVESGLCIRVQ